MRFDHSSTIQAAPERVWEVFSNVERWPDWTPTVDSVERLDAGRIHVGARTRIRQPKLPVAVWEVTELKEGEYFEWVSKAPGIKTTGGHRVVSTFGCSEQHLLSHERNRRKEVDRLDRGRRIWTWPRRVDSF